MIVSVEVEDEAWSALADLDAVTRRAVLAVMRAGTEIEGDTEINVLFTDDASIASINLEWRGKNYATNVLSFPAPGNMPVPDGEARPLGDIVLASGMVTKEALEQGKSLHDHTVHLIVHGTLHLLGYDHIDDEEANKMERLETDILKGLGIPNPYERQ